MQATCEYCGEPFQAVRSTARFCSVAHRMAAHRGAGEGAEKARKEQQMEEMAQRVERKRKQLLESGVVYGAEVAKSDKGKIKGGWPGGLKGDEWD